MSPLNRLRQRVILDSNADKLGLVAQQIGVEVSRAMCVLVG